MEAIYAHASDQPDRYSIAKPVIELAVEEMAEEVQESAAETGGYRTLRFVTSLCQPVIQNVTLSSAGDDSLGATASELRALGFNRSDRDYVVFVDASVYCGIGYVGYPYARVDTACWDYAPLHELTHNLGAVQLSAPNSSGGFHCTDESDIMCYSDEPNHPAMRQICPITHDRLLDCGHDDYFSTAPPAGSYLSAFPSFNTADSVFMADVDGEPPVFLPEKPGTYTGSDYRIHVYNADDDLCVYGEGPAAKRVRFFCIGYQGDRSADITGALLAVAGGQHTARLRLVGTDRSGGTALGFMVWSDNKLILDERGGQAGVSSTNLPLGSPDPITHWPVFYEHTLDVDLTGAVEKAKKASACSRAKRQMIASRSGFRSLERRIARAYRHLSGEWKRGNRSGWSPTSSRRYAHALRAYRRMQRHDRALHRQFRQLRRQARKSCKSS